MCVSPDWLGPCWAVGVECMSVSPHWLATHWAVGVECVCVSPYWLAPRCAVGVECVCVSLLADPSLGRRCGVGLGPWVRPELGQILLILDIFDDFGTFLVFLGTFSMSFGKFLCCLGTFCLGQGHFAWNLRNICGNFMGH